MGFGGVFGKHGVDRYAAHHCNPSSRLVLQMVGTADRRATDTAAERTAHSAEIELKLERDEQRIALSTTPEPPAFDGNNVVEKQKHYHEPQKTEPPENADTTATDEPNSETTGAPIINNSNKEEMKRQLAELLNERKQRQSFGGGGGVSQNSASTAEDTYLKVLMGVGGTPPPPSQSADGLSKYHQRLLTPTIDRQRFVTGKYPLYVTVKENPTRRWLRQVGSKRAAATSEVLINGTSIDRSLASYDRFQWLDGEESIGDAVSSTNAINDDEYDAFSLELLAEIYVRKPGYVNILAGDGAGSSGAAARELKEQYKGWNRWRFHADNPFHERWWLDEQESDRLWITGFSLTKQAGELTYVDVDTGYIGTVNKRTAKAIRWPNEVNSVPVQAGEARHGAPRQHQLNAGDITPASSVIREQDDALLVSDGFLVPGRDRGGLYIIRNPGNEDSEWRICLTGGEEARVKPEEDGWFYHRAIWADLTGDGRQSILTARAKIPSILSATSGGTASEGSTKTKQGQLVWLERPKPHSYDETTGTALDVDGTVFDPFSARNTPWKVRVLDEGPDVMFSVADLDSTDDTIEVIASQFFSRKLSLHSIKIGAEPKVSFSRVIDDRCGASFSSLLANLDGTVTPQTQTVVDSGSTVTTLQPGDAFSHLLITSHECQFAEDAVTSGSGDRNSSSDQSDNAHTVVGDGVRYNTDTSSGTSNPNSIDGGSLFAYRVPAGKNAWKTEPWTRSVIATGFRVRAQLGNMINPGAPGFCYTFYPTKNHQLAKKKEVQQRPLIGIAGDCAEAAYILRPVAAGDDDSTIDRSTKYALMCEIETGATVGSIGIGYDDFANALQQSGYAKIYVPCYEQNKILVFAMGDKQDDEEEDDGW